MANKAWCQTVSGASTSNCRSNVLPASRAAARSMIALRWRVRLRPFARTRYRAGRSMTGASVWRSEARKGPRNRHSPCCAKARLIQMKASRKCRCASPGPNTIWNARQAEWPWQMLISYFSLPSMLLPLLIDGDQFCGVSAMQNNISRSEKRLEIMDEAEVSFGKCASLKPRRSRCNRRVGIISGPRKNESAPMRRSSV